MEQATVERVNFSDPQGGKGPYDRRAATIKARLTKAMMQSLQTISKKLFYPMVVSEMSELP